MKIKKFYTQRKTDKISKTLGIISIISLFFLFWIIHYFYRYLYLLLHHPTFLNILTIVLFSIGIVYVVYRSGSSIYKVFYKKTSLSKREKMEVAFLFLFLFYVFMSFLLLSSLIEPLHKKLEELEKFGKEVVEKIK